MGGGHTFNFYGVTPDKMISEVKSILAKDVYRSGRF